MNTSSLPGARLKTLIAWRSAASVSIYMPTHPAGPDAWQDRIRLKNLLAEAHDRLVEAGMRSPEAHERLAGAAALVDDSGFWRHQGQGLALLIGEGRLEVFRTPTALPQTVIVGERFHLKGLLALLQEHTRFHVLMISQNAVALYRGSEHQMTPVPLPGAPKNLEEVTRFDQTERHLSFHTARRRGPAGTGMTVFHGQGVGSDKALVRRKFTEYCHQVDRAVASALQGGNDPLFLAATEPLASMYRQASTCPRLQEVTLRGNGEVWRPRDLQRQALALMVPLLEAPFLRDAQTYRRAAGNGGASNKIVEIASAVFDDRVAVLFVAEEDFCWGRFDPDQRRLILHDVRQDGDEDLLDLAAARACMTGASVHVVPRNRMPGNVPIAAVFRYSARTA